MAKTKLKHLNIPITDEHNKIFAKVARKNGLTETAWARNALLKASGVI